VSIIDFDMISYYTAVNGNECAQSESFNRSTAMSQASRLISIPMQRRPAFNAANSVVPLPMYGSQIMSSGFVNRLMIQ